MVEVSLCGTVAGICFMLELLNYNFFGLKTLTSFIISTPKNFGILAAQTYITEKFSANSKKNFSQ